jgi:hypothetical protein
LFSNFLNIIYFYVIAPEVHYFETFYAFSNFFMIMNLEMKVEVNALALWGWILGVYVKQESQFLDQTMDFKSAKNTKIIGWSFKNKLKTKPKFPLVYKTWRNMQIIRTFLFRWIFFENKRFSQSIPIWVLNF